jgi:hypothetical protein
LPFETRTANSYPLTEGSCRPTGDFSDNRGDLGWFTHKAGPGAKQNLHDSRQHRLEEFFARYFG